METHPSAPVEQASPAGLASLSPSRAGDFKICPQLFKFRAIDGLPEPATTYQARGTTAHLALQDLFELPAPQRTPQALYDLFRAAWARIRNDEYAELFASVEDERAWGLESLELLSNYFALEDPRAIEPLQREQDLTERLGRLTVRGILDRMDENERGELVIVDYKTGKAPPERYARPAFFALKIYGLLVRKRTGRTPVELRLIYLNGPTMYRLGVGDAELDAMHRQLEALWDAIERALQRDHFPPRVGPLCGWCSFREICPAWQGEADEQATEPLTMAGVAGR